MNPHDPLDAAGTSGATTEIDELSPAMTHQDMDAALENGHARPLSRYLTDFVFHAGNWWVIAADGWLRVDDPRLVAAINSHNRRTGE